MNLLDGNKFSPWENFFVNPFGSDVISPNQLCKCTLVQVLVEARAVVHEWFCSRGYINPLLL